MAMRMMTTRLTMAILFLRRRRRPSFQKLTLSRMTTRLCFSSCEAGRKSSTLSCRLNGFFFRFPTACSSLSEFDARVNDFVQDVHDHVGDDDHGGQQDRG